MYAKLRKIIAVLITAIVGLSVVAGPAWSRTRIELSTTAVLMAGRLTFTTEQAAVICDVTFHATLLRLINKVRLEHVGDVTAVLTANARSSIGGAATCGYLPPLRIGYGSISGTLPTITGGEFQFTVGVLVTCIFSACLYLGSSPFRWNENGFRTLVLEGSPAPPLFTNLSGMCPLGYAYTGSMTVTPTVTVRLLER